MVDAALVGCAWWASESEVPFEKVRLERCGVVVRGGRGGELGCFAYCGNVRSGRSGWEAWDGMGWGVGRLRRDGALAVDICGLTDALYGRRLFVVARSHDVQRPVRYVRAQSARDKYRRFEVEAS